MMAFLRWLIGRHHPAPDEPEPVRYDPAADAVVRGLRLERKQSERRTRHAQRQLDRLKAMPIESDVFFDRNDGRGR